ncbi:unnamed protein product [Prunus armeniaca]
MKHNAGKRAQIAAGVNRTIRDTPTSSCWTWTRDLNNLEEEYGFDGHNLSTRVDLSGLESTGRDCKPCGTTIIPYPLSTGPDCGDPMYFRFNCSIITGQVSFVGPNGTFFRVISVNQSAQRFAIQTKNVDYCDLNRIQGQQLNPRFPFSVTRWCYVHPGNFSSQLSSGDTNAVELGWELPLEPTCTTSADCRGWPHSTCSPARDRKKRCLCNANYQWSGFDLNCTQDKINRAQLDSERRVQELIDAGEFKEEDEKGIDLPFFDLQSILDATDNFSYANKLGQGGYGPVYKVMEESLFSISLQLNHHYYKK